MDSTRSSTTSQTDPSTTGGCGPTKSFNLDCFQEQPQRSLPVLRTYISNLQDSGQTLARYHLSYLQDSNVIQNYRTRKDKLVNLTEVQSRLKRLMDACNRFDGTWVDRLIPKKDCRKDMLDLAFKTYSEEFWRNYLGIPQVRESFFLMLRLIWLYDRPKLCKILCIDGRHLSDSELREVKLALWDHLYAFSPGCPLAEDLRQDI